MWFYRFVERNGQIDATAHLQSEEFGWGDPDDGVWHLVNRDRPAEDARVASEPMRPVSVPEDDDPGG